MRIEGSYLLPCEPARAYQSLQDPELLARCMPGCEALDKIGDETYAMRLKMVLASISGLFDGTIRVADSQFPDSFRLIVEGSGKIGFVKGEGLLVLTPAESATDVRYEGDVQVGGTIASVGQRLLDTTSKMMIKRFFSKMAKLATEPD